MYTHSAILTFLYKKAHSQFLFSKIHCPFSITCTFSKLLMTCLVRAVYADDMVPQRIIKTDYG